MEAKDIRIGNYYDNNGVYKTITPNDIQEIWEAKRTWCKPIPLTEEWFLKLGFFKTPNENFEFKNVLIEMYGTALPIEMRDFRFSFYGSYIEIKYVHQLQNLYYSLTGLELPTGAVGGN